MDTLNMIDAFFILIISESNSKIKMTDYDIILDKNNNWAIVKFSGELDHNRLFYNEIVDKMSKQHPYSYIAIKHPDGNIIINQSNISSICTLVDFNMDDIDNMFKKIEKDNL